MPIKNNIDKNRHPLLRVSAKKYKENSLSFLELSWRIENLPIADFLAMTAASVPRERRSERESPRSDIASRALRISL